MFVHLHAIQLYYNLSFQAYVLFMKTKEIEKKSSCLNTKQTDFSNIPVELRETAAFQIYMDENPLELPNYPINVIDILKNNFRAQEAKICK